MNTQELMLVGYRDTVIVIPIDNQLMVIAKIETNQNIDAMGMMVMPNIPSQMVQHMIVKQFVEEIHEQIRSALGS